MAVFRHSFGTSTAEGDCSTFVAQPPSAVIPSQTKKMADYQHVYFNHLHRLAAH